MHLNALNSSYALMLALCRESRYVRFRPYLPAGIYISSGQRSVRSKLYHSKSLLN